MSSRTPEVAVRSDSGWARKRASCDAASVVPTACDPQGPERETGAGTGAWREVGAVLGRVAETATGWGTGGRVPEPAGDAAEGARATDDACEAGSEGASATALVTASAACSQTFLRPPPVASCASLTGFWGSFAPSSGAFRSWNSTFSASYRSGGTNSTTPASPARPNTKRINMRITSPFPPRPPSMREVARSGPSLGAGALCCLPAGSYDRQRVAWGTLRPQGVLHPS